MRFNTLDEIKAAVQEGFTVYWKNDSYVVVVDLLGQWHVAYRPWDRNPNYVGLYWADGVTSDYNPEDFYIVEELTA